MRAERLRLVLRPRPAFEAVDLGVRLTQQAAPSLWRAYLPLALLLAAGCGCTIEVAGWLPATLLWWLKPWLDRTLLDIYARHAFGDATRFADAWRARARAPWLPLLRQLTWARLSPVRAYAMPVSQLEGTRGAARAARMRLLLRGQRGAAVATQQAFAMAEAALMLGLLSLGTWLTPGLRDLEALRALTRGDAMATASWTAAYALAVLFLEPFHVATGFAMYLNRRVELEAWDVEQELRDAFEPG